MTTIADIIDQVIVTEGGYVNNPNDPGGETIYGITIQTARLAGYMGDMRQMPREAAFKIYFEKYVSGPHFDQVSKLSMLIAAELVDTGVNQGVPQAASYLQRSLNLFNLQGKIYEDVHVDLNVGFDTLAALKKFLAFRGSVGEQVMVKALNCMQGARYIDLGEKNPKLEDFEFGWFANRI